MSKGRGGVSIVRFSRHHDAFELSSTLGIPGRDLAPLEYDANYPESNPAVLMNGYSEPLPLKPESLQYRSFVNHEIDTDSCAKLMTTVQESFNDWESTRSSEVVFKTDGLDLILANDMRKDTDSKSNSQSDNLFFIKLASESNSLSSMLKHRYICHVKCPLQSKQLPMNGFMRKSLPPWVAPLIDISHERIPALRSSWWVRLVYLKENIDSESPRSLGWLRRKWTSDIASFLSRQLCESSYVNKKKGLTKKVMPVSRRNHYSAASRGTSQLTTTQLTDSIDIKKDNLEQWLYIWSIAENQFDKHMIDRDYFVECMLTCLESMHVESVSERRRPLPFCICHLFVCKVAALAPHMSIVRLETLWKICCRNLRMIAFSSEEIQNDPAISPLNRILEELIHYIESVVDENVHARWKHDVNTLEVVVPDSPKNHEIGRISPPLGATTRSDQTASQLVSVDENKVSESPHPWTKFEAIDNSQSIHDLLSVAHRVTKKPRIFM